MIHFRKDTASTIVGGYQITEIGSNFRFFPMVADAGFS